MENSNFEEKNLQWINKKHSVLISRVVQVMIAHQVLHIVMVI